jgi:DNA mismatch repair protein MutS
MPYKYIFSRIIGNDNIFKGLSTFAVEMSELRTILRLTDENSLILGDELCSGTETLSAISIFVAGIQKLHKRRSSFIFATHLHELGEYSGVKAYHLSVRAQGSTLVYDRILKEGAGSAMYGLEVCRGLDMDPDFLLLAFQLRERRLGSTAKASRYNAAVTVSTCSICGVKDNLETHHIVPQREFREESKTNVGTSKNRVSNLAVLCAACHDKHHAGSLTVGSWIQTTEGRKLV